MHTVSAGRGAVARATAWLGGGMFVASLGYFAWSYTFRFGRTAAVDTSTSRLVSALLLNALLFTVFALHHSVMARAGPRRWLARVVPPPLERSIYVWIASLLFILTCVAWQPIPIVLYDVPWPWRGACVATQLWGVWLTARSARLIDPLELAGIRQVHRRVRPAALEARGPYCLVRHPIYLGWVLMTFGTPLMTGTRLSFAAISTTYLLLAIPFEERSLEDAFGEEYRAYRQRVRWRMLPGLY
jgi:protein-S-isoprenylcysteine O-methyltransferase Ste14